MSETKHKTSDTQC